LGASVDALKILGSLGQSPGLRPLWNNPAISTTTAALKYNESVEISEKFHDDNSAINL